MQAVIYQKITNVQTLVLASLVTKETLSNSVTMKAEQVSWEAVLSSPHLVTAWAISAPSPEVASPLYNSSFFQGLESFPMGARAKCLSSL